MAQNGDMPDETLNPAELDTLDLKGKHVLAVKKLEGEHLATVQLEKVVVFPKLKFNSRRDYRRYQKLIRDLKKVYPYAQQAKYKLIKMEREFQSLKTDKERKRYIKQVEKELKDEFKDDIKKLTITQGRLLLKLIDRETGNTSYQLLEELKGNFSAFFWQTLARVFGHNLKSEYEPSGSDWMIERIVVLIEHNQI